MSGDPIFDALEGPQAEDSDLDSTRDSLHLGLSWIRDSDPDGFDGWMEVLDGTRIRARTGRSYSNQHIAHGLTADLRRRGYDGPQVSLEAVRRWRWLRARRSGN